MADPLGEVSDSPVPHIVHRYPDRVLFLVTLRCSTYCRYCTRRRVVGEEDRSITEPELKTALGYIRSHPEIRDVLISGGDPLVMGNGRITYGILLCRQAQKRRFQDHKRYVEPALRQACKSCLYCVVTCPKKVLGTTEATNTKGYQYVQPLEPENCIGCGMDKIAESGLVMKDPTGEYHLEGFKTAYSAEDIGIMDVVVLMVKATQTDSAMKSAMKCIGPDTVVVTLQNGLGNDERLKKYVPGNRLIFGCGNM